MPTPAYVIVAQWNGWRVCYFATSLPAAEAVAARVRKSRRHPAAKGGPRQPSVFVYALTSL